MNHHPLHTNAWFAEHETVQGKNVVVGNLVYSLALGMSVPDVSGSCIANLEVESLLHRFPTFHGDTIYAETKVIDTGGVEVPRRPGDHHGRDQGVSTSTATRSVSSGASSWSGSERPPPRGAAPMRRRLGLSDRYRLRAFGRAIADWGRSGTNEGGEGVGDEPSTLAAGVNTGRSRPELPWRAYAGSLGHPGQRGHAPADAGRPG